MIERNELSRTIDELDILNTPSAEEERWLSATAISKELGINPRLFLKCAKGLRSTEGSLGGTRRVTLYNLSDVNDRFSDFLALPRVDDETGKYTDDYDGAWATVRRLAQEFGMSPTIMPRYLDGVSAIRGRDRSGRDNTLYSEPEVLSRIGKRLELPRVDKITGRYEDQNGVGWVSATNFRILLKSGQRLAACLQDVPTIDGRGKNNQPVTLYHEEEVLDKLGQIISLPSVDKESGIFTDNEGADWVTEWYFCETFGLTNSGMKKFLKGMVRMNGRDRIGHLTALYPRSLVESQINSFLELPRVDRKTGIHIDSDGEEWAAAQFFVDNFDISNTGLRQYLQGMDKMSGRDRHNEETSLYNRKQVLNQLGPILSLPRVDKETNKYVDENGESWVILKSFRYKVGIRTENLLDGIRSIRGRDRSNHIVPLYSELDIQTKVSSRLSLPQIDEGNGRYTDQDGDTWITPSKLVEESGVSSTVVYRGIRETKASVITGRDKLGRVRSLYREQDIKTFLANFLANRAAKQKQETISQNEANEQLRRLVEG